MQPHIVTTAAPEIRIFIRDAAGAEIDIELVGLVYKLGKPTPAWDASEDDRLNVNFPPETMIVSGSFVGEATSVVAWTPEAARFRRSWRYKAIAAVLTVIAATRDRMRSRRVHSGEAKEEVG